MKMEKVVTFGEIMLRLSTPAFRRFPQADSFDVTYGGAEANVSSNLSGLGMDSYFVTVLPENEIGTAALAHLRKFDIRTEYVEKAEGRMGVYFLESGASQRPSKVIYDRARSALAESNAHIFDWERILDGADWFHFTGITPALSDSLAEAVLEALRTSRRKEVKTSCDLNYRKLLWSREKARSVMTPLMEYIDVLFVNEEDADKVFGIKAEAADIEKGDVSAASYEHVARELHKRFGFELVAITLRESYSASVNGWSGVVYDGKEFVQSRKYNMHIVDRVGGGDAFAAGIIYGLLKQKTLKDTVDFAAACSAIKHTIPGDFNYVSLNEVEALRKSSGSGRIVR